ncbi:MAG: hypothetical protein IIA45_10450, partial [Bacteroidetes bacterium]|nr:hypothetical protein [Bacteroidota bacterium]
AIVPFYGQGMNAGFEDCSVLHEIMNIHFGEENLTVDSKTWEKVLNEYQIARKPNGDAIADLALRNFVEMRDLVSDPNFLLRKRIEKSIHKLYPEYLPLYSIVTFTHVPYSVALAVSKQQDEMMEELIKEFELDATSETISELFSEDKLRLRLDEMLGRINKMMR